MLFLFGNNEPGAVGTTRWWPPGIALQKRRFEENVKKRKSSNCLEKLGMPDEINATVLKMPADIGQNEKI